MTETEIKRIVAEVLAEQERRRVEDADETNLQTVALILKSFGIEEGDRVELRADFTHLRKWRRSVEEAQSLGFKIVVTTLLTGLIGAIGLGIKAWLGK